VGKVLLDGQDMNLRQIEGGLAWHYKKYAREQSEKDRKSYAEAEKEAQSVGIGLWQELTPIPPWDWRRGRGNQSVPARTARTDQACTFSVLYGLSKV